MSVHVNGRTTRQLPIAELAMKRQVSSEKFVLKVRDRGSYKIIIISFLVIVLGGTLSTVGTIQGSPIIYWSGLIILSVVAIYLVIHSRLNSPCSPQ